MVRFQMQMSHRLLEQVLEGVGEEDLKAKSAGTINPMSSILAHIVFVEDNLVNGRVMERETVAAQGNWAAKTGVTEPAAPRQPDDSGDWVKDMDIAAFREYAKAVWAATDEALANAPDDVLGRELDMGPLGKQTALHLVGGIALYHVGQHTGEIAALKGVRGLKGLPF